MLQKLLYLLKLESFRPHQEIAIQSIIKDQKVAVICTHIDHHNQHESAALIGLFHATSWVLTSVESYRNYQKPTQRGVQGYLSSLQRRVLFSMNIQTEYILIARANFALWFLAGKENKFLHKKVSIYKVYSMISMNRTHLFLTVNTST